VWPPDGRSPAITDKRDDSRAFSPGAAALVVIGGFFGAAAREALEQAWPTPAGDFPLATLVVNLAGAFLLGVLLEAGVRAGARLGRRRRRARLLAGTGFLGAFTTYSTLALEADLLVRAGHVLVAVGYLAASAAGGLAAAALGVAAGSISGDRRWAELPLGPDVGPADVTEEA
jgi:fluoride exporter